MIKNQWYAIASSSVVKKDKITGMKRLNRNIALFRDSQNNVCCVSDQCSHRGASLSIGKLDGDCIQCPFHGIHFDANGVCTQIPAVGIASKMDKSRFNVESYLVKEAHDIVYLWYGDKEKATISLPFFDEELNEFKVFSEIHDEWNAHYSRCIENQLDVIHLPFVHYNTIGRGHKTLVNGPKLDVEATNLTICTNNEVDKGQTPKGPKDCEMKATYLKFKFPNIWINHISDKIKAFIFFAPVDEEHTILYVRFYCKVTSSILLNRFIAFFGKYANEVIEKQDKRVVITQKPKASQLIMKENLLPGDMPVIQYRKIRQAMKDATQKQ